MDVLKGCDNLISLRTPLPAEEEKQFLGYLFGSDSHEDNARDVPAALKYLELGGNAHRLADFALFDCNDLVCVTLPKSMTEIGSYALYHCSSLLELNTAHLTRLAEHALDSCSALTVLTFGKELTSIGLGALEGCDALRSLTLPFVGGTPLENQYLGYVFGAEVPDHANGFYPTYLSAVEVLDGCIMLGGYAFYECETLTKVTLPETLTEIGIRAFAGCKRLIGLSFPDALKTIRENAFFDCISLQTVAFGDSSALSTLGINAFYNCYALTSVILPESLKSLPASCFACCLDLETVDFGGVTEVGKNAFRHCISLKNAVAPSDISLEEGNDSIEAILFAKQ